MRKFLYLSLMERLKQLTDETGEPVIKTFDLWNEQVSFLEQEEAFETPAVFIEFRPVKWNGGMPQQADVTLRLHIVTSWKGSAREGSEFRQSLLGYVDDTAAYRTLLNDICFFVGHCRVAGRCE